MGFTPGWTASTWPKTAPFTCWTPRRSSPPVPWAICFIEIAAAVMFNFFGIAAIARRCPLRLKFSRVGSSKELGTRTLLLVTPTSVALHLSAGTSASFNGTRKEKLAGRSCPIIGDHDGHQIVRRESALHG